AELRVEGAGRDGGVDGLGDGVGGGALEVAGGVLDEGRLDLADVGPLGAQVAHAVGELLDLAAHAVVARGAGAHGPVDGAALADRGGPRGADLHEVVGEGARRAAAVAAVDDADVLGGQAD